jgi:uncharacterized membrane protein YdbT with pleckstrin-like domain
MARSKGIVRLQDGEEIIVAFRRTAWPPKLFMILTLGLYIPWWRAGWMVLTDRRVMVRYGIFNREERSLPVHFVQDASVSRSWAGVGEVLISSAGGDSGNLHCPGLKPAHARQLADATLSQVRHASVGNSHAQQGTGDISEALTRLASLRDSGVLTEEEFAQQKTRLLGSSS